MKAAPPLDVINVDGFVPWPIAGVAKSDARAYVAATSSIGTITQFICSETRTLVVPLTLPAQDMVELVVGYPKT